MLIKKKKILEYLDIICIALIILTSNSFFYCILNMKIAMLVMMIFTLVYCIVYTHLKNKNLMIFSVLCFILFFNFIVNSSYSVLDKDYIILFIRCFFLLLVMSNVDINKFKWIFVHIVLILGVLSLVCFVYSSVLGKVLPFQTSIWTKEGKYYIYTFYHTLGRWQIQTRNCGVFTEPGIYQIILNFALLILLTNPYIFLSRMSKIQFSVYVIILIITILTTLSSTGYICLALVLLAALANSRSTNKKVRTLLFVLISIALIVFLLIENKYGIIASKVVDHEGSYSTRYNDTIVSLSLGLKRIFGYGYSNSITSSLLSQNGIKNNSNGIGSMLLCIGFPMTILYYTYIWNQLKRFLSLKFISSLIVIFFFILCMSTEVVFNITFFLSFLFCWKNEEKL